MKMMGSSGRASRTRRCKSRPSIPGIRTSVIKQLDSARWPPCRKSSPRAKTPGGETGGFDQALQRFANSGIVIDDSNDGFYHEVHQERDSLLPYLDSSGNDCRLAIRSLYRRLLCLYIRPRLLSGNSELSGHFDESASDEAAILRMICPRWTWIVISLVPSSAAVCLFSRPATTKGSTSRSRGVSRA